MGENLTLKNLLEMFLMEQNFSASILQMKSYYRIISLCVCVCVLGFLSLSRNAVCGRNMYYLVPFSH